MNLRCLLGHDYQKDKENRDVKCSRCGERHLDVELLLVTSEKEAWEKVQSGEWSRERAEDYVDRIWSDDNE
jgi:hypothetical protein